MREKEFAGFSYHPVIDLPRDYEVYDFSQGYDPDRELKSPYGIGKYNEKRPNMYEGELYEDLRDIHIGIDIGAPVGTEVKAFFAGQVLYADYNSAHLDYGHTLVTMHGLGERTLYALWGHLSKKSFEKSPMGHEFLAGEVLAWVGDKEENGGWNPHLHFQLSWEDPGKADMPGVVSDSDLQNALKTYPDPRQVLGPLY